MKPFDRDFALRSYFQAQYAGILFQAPAFDPFPPLNGSCSIEDTTLYAEFIGLTQPPHENLANAFSPQSANSDITYSTVITSPGSTDTFGSTITSPPPIPLTPTTAGSSKNKRKRQSTSEDATLDGRFKAVRLPKLSNLSLSRDKGKFPTVPPWAKSIIVRMKPRPDEVVKDLLYTFVKLPNPDVRCCVAAICAKMEIPFTDGMSVSWLDSETLLRGPFNHDFLQKMADMQDFVVDLVEIESSEDFSLLLEM